MPEAKFQIKRKCEVCGNTFIAKTLDSRYCCRHCTDIAYKKRKAAVVSSLIPYYYYEYRGANLFLIHAGAFRKSALIAS